MVLRRTNPWETQTLSSLVRVRTHSLHISTSGPPRPSPSSPVLIYITGSGAPAITHIRLQRLLSQFIRVYFYDRSGYDRSERGPEKDLTAEGSARELMQLMCGDDDDQMNGIGVKPPYILVGHSYGSIIARTFLALYPSPKIVTGMILADSATELMYELFPDQVGAEMQPLLRGLDEEAIFHYREKSQLTDLEWAQAMAATERSAAAAASEDNRLSAKQLVRHQQFKRQALGSRPLSVIRCNMAADYWREYDAGVAAGNGSAEERQRARAFVEKLEAFDDELRAAQLRLSARSRYVHFGDVGHAFVVTRPELLVQEVRWVLGQLSAGAGAGAEG